MCGVCLPFITEHVKHPNSPIRLEPQTDKTMSAHTSGRSANGGSEERGLTCSAMHREACARMQIHTHEPSVNLDSS